MKFEKQYLREMAGLELVTEKPLELEPLDPEHEKRKEERAKAQAEADKKQAEHKPAPASDAKPQSAEKKAARARAWMGSNKNATRKDFMTWAAKELGISGAHANTMFYSIKKKVVSESVFVIQHPMVTKFVLGMNETFDRYEWIDQTVSELVPELFETREAAEEFNDMILETRNFYGNVVEIKFDE